MRFRCQMNWLAIENLVPIDVLGADYRHWYFAGRWDQLHERPVRLAQRQQQQQQQQTRGDNYQWCVWSSSRRNPWRN